MTAAQVSIMRQVSNQSKYFDFVSTISQTLISKMRREMGTTCRYTFTQDQLQILVYNVMTELKNLSANYPKQWIENAIKWFQGYYDHPLIIQENHWAEKMHAEALYYCEMQHGIDFIERMSQI